MGHTGLEFASNIDKTDGENVNLIADFTEVSDSWNNPQRIKKNANPSVKHKSTSEVSIYNVNDFESNILLYEYQVNPKEIKLIPLSIQYRTAYIDGLLKAKIFCHANPKLPKRLFDIEVSVVLKEKEKLTLRDSTPHGIQTKEEIKFVLPGLEPNDKQLFEFEFLPSSTLENPDDPVEIILLKCKSNDYLTSDLNCNLTLSSSEYTSINPVS